MWVRERSLSSAAMHLSSRSPPPAAANVRVISATLRRFARVYRRQRGAAGRLLAFIAAIQPHDDGQEDHAQADTGIGHVEYGEIADTDEVRDGAKNQPVHQ